jgi:hypothetical protein
VGPTAHGEPESGDTHEHESAAPDLRQHRADDDLHANPVGLGITSRVADRQARATGHDPFSSRWIVWAKVATSQWGGLKFSLAISLLITGSLLLILGPSYWIEFRFWPWLGAHENTRPWGIVALALGGALLMTARGFHWEARERVRDLLMLAGCIYFITMMALIGIGSLNLGYAPISFIPIPIYIWIICKIVGDVWERRRFTRPIIGRLVRTSETVLETPIEPPKAGDR